MYMRLQPICPAAPVMTTRIGSAMIEFLETIKKKRTFLTKFYNVLEINIATTGQLPRLSLTEVMEKTHW